MPFTVPAHTPATGTVIPSATYGISLRDCAVALNVGFYEPLFPRSSGIAPASGLQGAGLITYQSTGAGTVKPEWPVLTFDKDTDEGRIWSGIIPRLYYGTMTINGQFYMASVVAGTVVFSAQIACHSDADAGVLAKVMAAANSCAAVTVPGVAGTIKEFSITMTNADSAAAIDSYELALFRDVSEDTAAGDVLLKRLDLFFALS